MFNFRYVANSTPLGRGMAGIYSAISTVNGVEYKRKIFLRILDPNSATPANIEIWDNQKFWCGTGSSLDNEPGNVSLIPSVYGYHILSFTDSNHDKKKIGPKYCLLSNGILSYNNRGWNLNNIMADKIWSKLWEKNVVSWSLLFPQS